MVAVEKLSAPERNALAAQSLPAFEQINLLGIRSGVEEMLRQIGRDGPFREYTVHDIRHIEALLTILEWLVPDLTARRMTPTDWLLIVLAIYFHDLGMLVTKDEFDNRDKSDFPQFKRQSLSDATDADYRAKIEKMSAEEQELFLYQEFVRENHARRIKAWISGTSAIAVGYATVAAAEVTQLVERLPPTFRRDLAVVCESHHLNDLEDFTKYKVEQPYGSRSAETANIHYAALLLRTVDLLDVTSDRAPSLAFRLINPIDPKSIVEWKKQMPVVSVRKMPALDRDGNVDREGQSDTIGFYATFTESDGFFALTAYLRYVGEQLQKTYEAAAKANKKYGTDVLFPWRSIDETNIEAIGFLKEKFEFTVDQKRILDLLTGHTLYNNVDVVVRELMQNAIDAVRVHAEDTKSDIATYAINIYWSSLNNTLAIEDSGTGMTQEVVAKHFLRVGSSKYQDEDFVKSHPDFSAISRFGIGVLSAFMVSDEVEVATVAAGSDEKARRLTLRSLHGRYLIREFERDSPELPAFIKPHGTRISLTLRAGASIPDVLKTTRHWVVFPPCPVFVHIDGAAPVKVGYQSPSEALSAMLGNIGVLQTTASGEVVVAAKEFEGDGVKLAVALKYSAYFREWELMTINQLPPNVQQAALPGMGTCIEGIRVDRNTPGYLNPTILAIANATGKNSPKTNVARSSLDSAGETGGFVRTVYRLFCSYVADEVTALQTVGGFSPTWAVGEVRFLLTPIVSVPATSPLLLEEEVRRVPSLLVEYGGERRISSVDQLASMEFVWTVDSAGIRSAEAVIKEIPAATISLTKFSELAPGRGFELPSEPVLCGLGFGHVRDLALGSRDIDLIKIDSLNRRIDLRWRLRGRGGKQRWVDLRADDEENRALLQQIYQLYGGRASVAPVLLLVDGIADVKGTDGESAVKSFGMLILLPESPIAKELLLIWRDVQSGKLDQAVLTIALGMISQYFLRTEGDMVDAQREVSQFLTNVSRIRNVMETRAREVLLRKSFVDSVAKTNWVAFDSSAWSRPNQQAGGF
jgi:molecular chaperone HtpG